ncbi:hypothetical protein IWX90DRAFT_437255 [Phyllosticta citrichinensis]|uniref:Uncharacterized protein n=1 Tax=Phyllosticta citrichinensis TaxID=1130410 RepID=A0ABR1XSE4_9PEZI
MAVWLAMWWEFEGVVCGDWERGPRGVECVQPISVVDGVDVGGLGEANERTSERVVVVGYEGWLGRLCLLVVFYPSPIFLSLSRIQQASKQVSQQAAEAMKTPCQRAAVLQ